MRRRQARAKWRDGRANRSPAGAAPHLRRDCGGSAARRNCMSFLYCGIRVPEDSMGTAENKQLLQDIFAATARGDSRPLVEAMADDFRWTIAGSGQIGRAAWRG